MEAGVLFYTVIGTGFGRHWWDSFCQWRHNNNSITVKCIFTSIFLLHPAAAAHLFPSRRESHITCFHPCGNPAESALSLHSPSYGGLYDEIHVQLHSKAWTPSLCWLRLSWAREQFWLNNLSDIANNLCTILYDRQYGKCTLDFLGVKALRGSNYTVR